MLSPERSDQVLVCYLLESMRTRIFFRRIGTGGYSVRMENVTTDRQVLRSFAVIFFTAKRAKKNT